MAEKIVARFKDWSKGIVSSVDEIDAGIDTLSNCENLKLEYGQARAYNTNTSAALSGLTNPKRAFFTVSKYSPSVNLGHYEYLYVYDDDNGLGGHIKRFYRQEGTTTWTLDSSFSVPFASSATDAAFAVNGDDIAFAGSSYAGDRFAVPYSELRFGSSKTVSGWMTNNDDTPTFFQGIETDVITHITSNTGEIGIASIASTIGSYSTDDSLKYYASVKYHSGYETEPVVVYEFYASTYAPDAYSFRFYVTEDLDPNIKSIVLYKELNNGGLYFMAEADMNDGIKQDFSESSVVTDSGSKWTASGSLYFTSWVSDNAIYNQPISYVSSRNGGKKLPSNIVTTFRNRFLFAGEDNQVNGVKWDAIYVSGLDGIGATYEDDYLSITKANGRRAKALATLNNYILVFYEDKTFVLDGSHPSPSMWRVIGEFPQGVNSDKSVAQTASTIMFANDNGVFAFGGQFSQITSNTNQDLYDEFIASDSGDIKLHYNSTERLLIIGGRPKAIAIDKNGALIRLTDAFDDEVLVEGDNTKTSFIGSNLLYTMFGGGNKLSGNMVSNDLIFENWHDKMLFKVRLLLYAKGVSSADFYLYLDGDQYYHRGYTVQEDTEIVIPLKARFKKLKYQISNFDGTIKEVEISVSARRYSRAS